MSQNRSSAVMQQRTEPHDSLDFFPTPPWATRALCQHVIEPHLMVGATVWEPACGDGNMLGALAEWFPRAFGSDVHDYGGGFAVHDFLQPYLPDGLGECHWAISNPPFKLAEEFILRGLAVASRGTAMLVRTSFIESVGRYRRLFSVRPPSAVAQFVERVPMVKGRIDRAASTATSYAWLVWARDAQAGTKMIWIPPCRSALERDSDYLQVAA